MQYNPYAFLPSDVIVWNGLIAEYGSVAHLMTNGDNMRRANADEEKNHKLAPGTSPYTA
jgi:hypothetical protein